jgi:2-dehydro-3-deoxyphosphogluconate aldolase/(4S)-4-hydroxy-2-oxoglutarate aldolase
MVKVFPTNVGGPALIRALKAPLPQVEMAPVGGVCLDTTADFIHAGAAVVGVGSALVNQELLDAGDSAALTERARWFVEVERGRAG